MMRRREIPLLAAVFLDLLGFGLAFTDIQFRAKAFGAPGWLIGVTLASYYLTQMLVSPLWGRVSDRAGRKPVLLACTLLSAASFFVYGWSWNVPLIVLSRVLAGMAGANVVVAQAYLADIYQEDARAASLGRLNGALMAGLFAGFVAGGWVAQEYGHLAVGLAGGFASLLAVAAIYLGVPAVAPSARAEEPQGHLSLLREVPPLVPMFWLATFGWFVLACLEGTFGLLIQERLGLAQGWFGLIAGYETLVGAAAGFAYVFLLKAASPLRLLQAGFALQGLGILSFPYVPQAAWLFLGASLFALGGGVAGPTINRICSDLTPRHRQGEMFGLLQAARSVGFVLGPIVGGSLFAWRPDAPYLLAGGVALALGLLAPIALRAPRPSSR
ncbi:MAG TPA: MFS transporter [Fimbriimonadaceae bacterium]|nr:MFS transporter [Fimbriimonadaceae bacterium]